MTSPFTDKRDRIEQALTFDAGCEPSAQEIIDALNRAGYQITPQAGEEAAVDKYVDDYVFEHDEGYYTPTTAERTLIKDAIMGFLPLLDDAAADCTAPPRPVSPVWQPKARVYAWLGYWRDKMPPEAVEKLQNILGPLNDSPGATEEA